MPMALDAVIVSSLRSFLAEIAASGWQGREREAVSLYAFGALLDHAGDLIANRRQIGIEVAVPQIVAGGKGRVNKDLVVWPGAHENAFSGASPLAVMEWKVDAEVKATRVSGPEFLETERWLEEFTALPQNARTAGYAVHLSFYPPVRAVSLSAFRNGRRRELTHELTAQ
ncbi:MAG: hypothetical protein K8T20_10365 [Planctomycetes bacterium]|nr:hypothetical protein [Planctomycetota bacterium]